MFVPFIVLSLFLWILLSFVDISLGMRRCLLSFSLVCGYCTVCHGLFALPVCVIGRLFSVSIALPGHILYYQLPNITLINR